MLDLKLVLMIFSSLRELVVNETKLSDFLPAATELLSQAEHLARGGRSVARIESVVGVPIRRKLPVIPDESLALAIREVFDRFPSYGDDEEEQLANAYRMLLRNAAVAVLFAVYEQYPHIIPKNLVQT